jgi:hypothetical protein
MATSLSLSLELLLLIDWLLKNEPTKLKVLVEDALRDGFLDELDNVETVEKNPTQLNDLHSAIIEFLMLLEDLLLETLEEKELSYKIKDKLDATLQKINPTSIDVKAVWHSLQQAKNQKADMKKTFFTQLLKNWKPKHNEPIN